MADVGFSDFTGIPIGVPPALPPPSFTGLVDFVGYYVGGMETYIPTGGLEAGLDFYGYPIAAPPPVVNPGGGLEAGVDFYGYPIGVPPPVPSLPASYHGLLDFAGYPVGVPAPVSAGRGHAYAGAKRRIHYLLTQQRYQTILDQAKITDEVYSALINRVTNQWAEYQYEMARHNDNTILAALLSEL